jgi:hypothetical protein
LIVKHDWQKNVVTPAGIKKKMTESFQKVGFYFSFNSRKEEEEEK